MNTKQKNYIKNKESKDAYQRDYDSRNAEKIKLRKKEYNLKNKERKRKIDYQSKWIKQGLITEQDDFDEIYSKFNETNVLTMCDICPNERKHGTGKLHLWKSVDFKIICANCNYMINKLDMKPSTMDINVWLEYKKRNEKNAPILEISII